MALKSSAASLCTSPSWTVISPGDKVFRKGVSCVQPLACRGANEYRNPDFIDGPENRTSTRPGQRHRSGRGPRLLFPIHLRYSPSLETPQQSDPVATEHVLHMQKALDQMNLQIHRVLSDITGLSGLRILDATLAGKRDP